MSALILMDWTGTAMHLLLDLGQLHSLSAAELDTISHLAERNAIVAGSAVGVRATHVRYAFASWNTGVVLDRLEMETARHALPEGRGTR
jgi:hypothetical protein